MSTRTKVFGCALALVLTAACVPAASEEEEFGENSPMLAIQREGTMVIAVPPDSPPFSFTGESGEPEGFLVDLGREVADALEVEAEFIEAPSEEMADLVAGDDPKEIGDEEAHVAFPLITVTNQIYKVDSRLAGHDLSTPFFVAHQRLLVPEGSTVERVDDLAGKSVCSLVDTELGIPIEELQPEAEVQDATSTSQCADALRKGDVDAVAGVEVDLITLLDELRQRDAGAAYEIVGAEITTQGYAPYVVRGMSAFASDVFTEVKEEGRWTSAYNEWIAPLTGEEVEEPPGLTLEEAAAMYPEMVFPDE